MLVLSRKLNEEIVIGGTIVVKVVEIRGDRVRLGIAAPPATAVHRSEIYDAIQTAGLSDASRSESSCGESSRSESSRSESSRKDAGR